MRKINKIMIMVLALVFCFSLAAQAALISTGTVNILGNMAGSTSGLGNFAGILEYFYDDVDSTIGQLAVALTNTTPVGGGHLTAFLMNNPGAITNITGFSAPNLTWQQMGLSNNGESANPFGDFDFGAGLRGDFEGGGSPNAGIPVSSTGNFTFDFSGALLNDLTTQSFINALSTDPSSSYGPEFFLARFRGLTTNPDSDKVPGVVVAPIPGSLLLLGSGLLGLFGLRRKLS